MPLEKNLTKTQIEFWFIPTDILMILCTGFVVLIAFLFLLITISGKTCRTVPLMLLCNTFLSEMIFASTMFSMAFFSLHNDIKQIQYEDSLCVFRAYMSYAMSAVRSHSYLLQTTYSYISIVYPSTSYYRSLRFQFYIVCFTWIISIIHPIPFLLTKQIKYNVDNQVCHMPYEASLSIFYTCFFAYLNPITIIGILYFKLVRFVQRMNKLVTPVNHLLRIQRELNMVRRIILLLIVLITLGLPYTIFFLMSFYTLPPKYHFRLAFLSVDLSLACVIISLFQFSDVIKTYIIEKMNKYIDQSI